MTKSKAQFHWDDPLLLDQQLTEDECMVRDAAQAYCRKKLQPRILEVVNTYEAYEGTHDIHALILGRAQTGIQTFQ